MLFIDGDTPRQTKVWNLDRVGAERTLSGKRLHNEMGPDASSWVQITAVMLTSGQTGYVLTKSCCYVNSEMGCF